MLKEAKHLRLYQMACAMSVNNGSMNFLFETQQDSVVVLVYKWLVIY